MKSIFPVHINPKSQILPIAALVSACVIWGSSFLFGKGALSELAVSHVVLLRFLIASVLLLPIGLIRKDAPRTQDLPLFFITGFLTVPVTYLLQFGGLALTNVSSASIIIGAFPPLMAIAAMMFFGERPGPRGWIAILLSTLGILIIFGVPDTTHNLVGDGMVILSLITSVIWVTLSKRLMERYDALAATSYIILCGTISLIPISLLWDGLPELGSTAAVWIHVLALGIPCTGLAYVLWNWGLSRIEASRAAVYVNLEPVVGAILGVMILDESIRLSALVGGSLILFAAFDISRCQVAGPEAAISINSKEINQDRDAILPITLDPNLDQS